MTYKRGGVSIFVYQIDGFMKNPGLWIGTDEPNQMVKVASFGSKDKADTFCKWLEYMLGINNDEQEDEAGMSATVYKWIIVYDDGRTEEKWGESPYDFADDLIEAPVVAIIRNGY